MKLTVRDADQGDVSALVALYGRMEEEQVARTPIWAMTDGLDEPFDASLSALIKNDDVWFRIGEIDAVAVGFISASIRETLERSGGMRIGRIDLIYTQPEARGVGVGHAMLEDVLTTFRALGITRFDVPVGPGQRLTKNFFEGQGFATRSLIMHHVDRPSVSEE